MVDYVGDILSGARRAQLLSLQKTARQLDATSLRLATGKKVSSALDNASSYFAARSLDYRAQDLGRLLDGIGQNIRTIEMADHGIDAMLDTLDLAENYLEDVEQKYMTGEISGLPAGFPTNETRVTFSGSNNLIPYDAAQDMPGTGSITVTGNNEVSFDGGSFWRRKLLNYNITEDMVLVFEFRSTASPEIVSIGFDNDTSFSNNTDRFFLYGSQASFLSYSEPLIVDSYAVLGEWQRYEINVGDYFTGNFSHITFIDDDDDDDPDGGIPFGNASFRNVTLREGAEEIFTPGASYEDGYAKILAQLDSVAQDANYRGVNLLAGDSMTSYFNADRSNTLLTEGIDATIEGLGLDLTDFNSIEAVREKLVQVRAAREVLRGYGNTLATDFNVLQVREDFIGGQINVSKAGADDLTDADLSEEGATYLALQTQQQLEISMLALRPATVLSILS